MRKLQILLTLFFLSMILMGSYIPWWNEEVRVNTNDSTEFEGEVNFKDTTYFEKVINADSMVSRRDPLIKAYTTEHKNAASDNVMDIITPGQLRGNSSWHFHVTETHNTGDTVLVCHKTMNVHVYFHGTLYVGTNVDENAGVIIGKLNSGGVHDTTFTACGRWGWKGTKSVGDEIPINATTDILMNEGDSLFVMIKTTDAANVYIADDTYFPIRAGDPNAAVTCTFNITYNRDQ